MCISLYFGIVPICWCLDRPNLFYIVAAASNSDVVKRFSAAMFRFFYYIGRSIVVGFAGVTIRMLLVA